MAFAGGGEVAKRTIAGNEGAVDQDEEMIRLNGREQAFHIRGRRLRRVLRCERDDYYKLNNMLDLHVRSEPSTTVGLTCDKKKRREFVGVGGGMVVIVVVVLVAVVFDAAIVRIARLMLECKTARCVVGCQSERLGATR